jgi:hypothetical protein
MKKLATARPARKLATARLLSVAAQIDIHVKALFRRCPALCSFTVRDRASLPDHIDPTALRGELFILDIAVSPRYGRSQYDEIYDQIAAAIGAAVAALPEAKELLRGRTFIRALH